MEAVLESRDRLFTQRDAYQTLCGYCKRIFRHLAPPHEYQNPYSRRQEVPWHEHHAVFGRGGLMDCATKCELCRQMMGRFMFLAGNYSWTRLSMGESLSKAKTMGLLEQVKRLEFCVVNGHVQEIWGRFISIDEEPMFSWARGSKDISFNVFPNSIHTFYSTSDLGSSTSSWGTMELAKKWYRDCKSNHQKCSLHTGSTTTLPTRLVEIRHNRIQNLMRARLLRGDLLPSDTAYVALSHCWGKAQFFNLTKENYNASMKAFPMDELPRTFLDAFDITSKLGFHYIWIDSLCIIQDSDDDWKFESSRMGEVYQNAALTLSSSESSSALEGCYKERQSFGLDILTNLWPDRAPMPVNGFRISKRGHYSISDRVRKTPIHSRGWTIQERALSPRLLHFTHYGIFWECEHCTRSEMAQDGSSHGTTKLTLLGRETKKDSSLETVWSEIVKQYTNCELTRPEKDKLVAISGLAKTLRNHLPDQYLAGLWKSRLITDLCWSTLYPSTTRPSEYRAPSWSWASIDSGVSMMDASRSRKNGRTLKPFATITGADTCPVTGDEFGQLSGGTLELDCYMLPVRLPRRPFTAKAPMHLWLKEPPRVEFLCKIAGRTWDDEVQILELDQENFFSNHDTWCLPLLGRVDYQKGFSEAQNQIAAEFLTLWVEAEKGGYYCPEDLGEDEVLIRKSSKVKETFIRQASNVVNQLGEHSQSNEGRIPNKGSFDDHLDKDEEDSEDDYSEDEEESADDYSESEEESGDDSGEEEELSDDFDDDEESEDDFDEDEHDCSEENGVAKRNDESERYEEFIFLVIEAVEPEDPEPTRFRRIGRLKVILQGGAFVDTVSFPSEFRRERICLV